MAQREAWIDCWKGILIFLVVLGHVAGMMNHLATGEGKVAMEILYKWIYLFHMPAFFVLSGYLWKTPQKGFVDFLRKKAKRLLVPYFFWGVVSIVIFLAMEQVLLGVHANATDSYYAGKVGVVWWQPFLSLLHGGGWPHGEGFRYNSVLWFLACLFSIQVIYYWIDRLKLPKMGLVVLMAGLFVLGGAVRIYNWGGAPWGLSLVPRYLAYFILGKLTVRWFSDLSLKSWVIGGGWPVFTGLVLVYPNLFVGFCHWNWYVAEGAMALVGISLCAVTAQRLTDYCPLVVTLGIASLGIMLIHKFLVLVVQIGLGKTQLLASAGVGLSIVAAIGVSVAILGLAYRTVSYIRRVWATVLGEG